MPKILIREYDNSTTGISVTNDFTVLVPGFFGNPKPGYNPTDLLIDHDVYEIKSPIEFENYIGKHSSTEQEGSSPTLETIVNNDTEVPVPGYAPLKGYVRNLAPADFDSYLNAEGERIYNYQVISVSTNNSDYGKNGHLLLTIKGEEDNILGTYKFIKVEEFSDINWNQVNSEDSPAGIISDSSNFCRIKEGNEGTDAIVDAHIGNQMAYELLKLGYTVLFKKITGRLEDLNESNFWEALKDKSVFNFRYVSTGGYYNVGAMNRICELAKFNNNVSLEVADTLDTSNGRGDCIALCDLDETAYGISSSLSIRDLVTKIGTAVNAISGNEYSAIFAPKVTYNIEEDEAFGKNRTFPASFHYLACAARAFERYAEWYAVAGYNRGISNLSVSSTSVNLGEIAINTLAPRIANSYVNKAVNLVLNERGNYYLWGNRTAYALDDKGLVFHHFLNIRQLCTSIKKRLYTACRNFTFDPNSDILWINFVNAIKPTLEAMRADQGIKGYTISKVVNDKKALLTARIRIVPIEAVEDFDISIYLEDSITGIIVNAEEAEA